MSVSVAPKRHTSKLIPVKLPVQSYRSGGISERTYYVNPDKQNPGRNDSTQHPNKVIAMKLLKVMREIRAPQGRAYTKFVNEHIGQKREYRVIFTGQRGTTPGRTFG